MQEVIDTNNYQNYLTGFVSKLIIFSSTS
uniref:Uncharacterized protein n=1 Tax=Anguilla anguilla TaxID=7936 RepID=A0A0E9XBU2_ANGAN